MSLRFLIAIAALLGMTASGVALAQAAPERPEAAPAPRPPPPPAPRPMPPPPAPRPMPPPPRPTPPPNNGGHQPPPPPNNGGHQPTPPPNNGGHQPTPPPNNGGHQPTPPPNNGGHQPTPPPNNGGHQPTPPPNNGGHQPTPPPNNGGHQPPPPPNNGGHQPTPPPNNGGHQPPPPPNNGGHQPPPNRPPNPPPAHQPIQRPVTQPIGNHPGFSQDKNHNIMHTGDDARIYKVQQRIDPKVIAREPRVKAFVQHNAPIFQQRYAHPFDVQRGFYSNPAIWNARWNHFRDLGWWDHHFYPYYWQVNAIILDSFYFADPCLAWYYLDYDADFYSYEYGQYWQQYPVLHSGYSHLGIFFPTAEFVNLNLLMDDVSDLGIATVVGYRSAMEVLGDRLTAVLSSAVNAPAQLGLQEVVISHYQILPNYSGVVLEGYVNDPRAQFPFKALLNFALPQNTIVFGVSGADAVLTTESIQQLDYINDQIVQMGGVLEDAP